MTDAVLLNSGGIDSRVAAAIMASEDYGWQLHSLHIPFNPNNREVCKSAAGRTAERYCVSHEIAREPDNWITRFRGFEGYPHTGVYVHLLGAMYAVHRGFKWVVSGYRMDVMAFDWTGDLTNLVSASKVHQGPVFSMPLKLYKGTADGLEMAREIGVDISDTHSCWTDPPCGTCHKCTARSGTAAVVGGSGVHSQ